MVRVDKKEIFALAAKALRLSIEAEKTFEMDDDLYMTKIEIGNILCKETCKRGSKEFIGKPALTKKLSIHNAFSAAIKYLEDESMIQVDDYNADNVSRLKQELFSSDSWSMLFEHKTKKLIHTINRNDAKLHDFIISFDTFYQEASNAFQLLAETSHSTPPKKRLRREAVLGIGQEDPASAMKNLSDSLFKMRTQLDSLVGKKI